MKQALPLPMLALFAAAAWLLLSNRASPTKTPQTGNAFDSAIASLSTVAGNLTSSVSGFTPIPITPTTPTVVQTFDQRFGVLTTQTPAPAPAPAPVSQSDPNQWGSFSSDG